MKDWKVISPPIKTRFGWSMDMISPGGGEALVRFQGQYGGLQHAGAENPAYFVLFGEILDDRLQSNFPGQGDIYVLREIVASELSVDGFLRQVADAGATYGFTEIFGDRDDEASARAFDEYNTRHRQPLSLCQGPFPDNLHLATSLMRDWIARGFLRLHETSVLKAQLQEIRKEDFLLPRSKLEARFYAISAARWALGQRHLEGRRPRVGGHDSAAGDYAGIHSWML